MLRQPRRSSEGSVTPLAEAILWASPSMRILESDIAYAFRSDLNVMITGESGLGKTSIADRIHRRGRRAAEPCVVAGSPGALDSTDTFGRALIDAMPGGTVQIEEAERMPPASQSRLLEFIERRLTETAAPRPSTFGTRVRFITMANSSLFELVGRQRFSESLFYRLNVIHLVVPPLRERPEDIPVLLRHFLTACGAPLPRLSPSAWRQLVTYNWPGNIRELRAVADALAVRETDRFLEADDLPANLRTPVRH